MSYKKHELVSRAKQHGLSGKVALKKPKRTLLMLHNRFRLFSYGVDIVKGKRYA